MKSIVLSLHSTTICVCICISSVIGQSKELPSANTEPYSSLFLDLISGRRSYDVTRFYEDLGQIPKGFLSESCFEDLQLLNVANSRNVKGGNQQLSDFDAAVFLKALDAAGRIGNGISRGESLFGGDFKGCREINFHLPERERPFEMDYFRYYVNPMIATNQDRLACMSALMGLHDLIFGVCLPSSCSTIELIHVLRPPSGSPSIIPNPICNLVRINDNVPEKDGSYDLAIVLVQCLIGFCFISGVLDYFISGDNTDDTSEFSIVFIFHQISSVSFLSIFPCFSIYRNLQSLFRNPKDEERNEDSIRVLGAIKVLSITWILFGHGSRNIKELHEFLRSSLSGQIILSSFFAVDTFFFISGLLLSYIWLKFYHTQSATCTRRGWIMFYVHRFIRLTPLYYFVLLFYTFIFIPSRVDVPYIMTDRFKEDPCSKCAVQIIRRLRLWQSFAYMTNLLSSDDQCLSFTWYLSVDFQLFAISPFFLYLLGKTPIRGVITCVAAIGASTLYNFYLVFKYNLPAKLAMLQQQIDNNSDLVTAMYNSPLIRAQIYLLGIVAGFILRSFKRDRINPTIDITLWFLSVMSLTLIYLNFSLYSHTEVIPLHISALFSSFSRIFWGLSLFWIIFSTHNGGGGPIRSLLFWPGWSIPSRLTYATYLVHVITIKWLFDMNTLSPRFAGFLYESITLGIPSIVLSFSTAALAHLFVERPAANLYVLILRTSQIGKSVKNE